ncbi:MAG: type II toxin-antitoxin system prevent-host-death family antitoxin [Burkholderiaceae bacterium]|jgi:prevent-host-death family protein|nr:type II toxin-antitoxin system prevent-host-death family antitoxin [Burkholderiaceae bacterium]
MTAALLEIASLPRQSASQVKNKWGEVVRQVREVGSVAITNHSAVEMVLVDAATYRQLTAGMTALQARERAVLDDLTGRFDARLAALQEPQAPVRVAGLFAAQGQGAARPRAGSTF